MLCPGEAVESVVEAVDCCRLLCALESSSFVEAVVVKAIDCYRLHYVLYRAPVVS